MYWHLVSRHEIWLVMPCPFLDSFEVAREEASETAMEREGLEEQEEELKEEQAET